MQHQALGCPGPSVDFVATLPREKATSLVGLNYILYLEVYFLHRGGQTTWKAGTQCSHSITGVVDALGRMKCLSILHSLGNGRASGGQSSAFCP